MMLNILSRGMIVLVGFFFLPLLLEASSSTLKPDEVAEYMSHKVGFSKDLNSFLRREFSSQEYKAVTQFLKNKKISLNQKMQITYSKGNVFHYGDSRLDLSDINRGFVRFNNKPIQLSDKKSVEDYFNEISKSKERSALFSLIPNAYADMPEDDSYWSIFVRFVTRTKSKCEENPSRSESSLDCPFLYPENYLIDVFGDSFKNVTPRNQKNSFPKHSTQNVLSCATEEFRGTSPKPASFTLGNGSGFEFEYSSSGKVIKIKRVSTRSEEESSCYNYKITEKNGKRFCSVEFKNEGDQGSSCLDTVAGDPLASYKDHQTPCEGFIRAMEGCCSSSQRCTDKIYKYLVSTSEPALLPPVPPGSSPSPAKK